jgi:glycosyltransferase involved in cell wall biosynthesis
MDWLVASPFIHSSNDNWLIPFVPNSVSGTRTIGVVPALYRHDRSKALTNLNGWKDYLDHGFGAWSQATQSSKPKGLITCFPQLALIVGMRKRASFKRLPVVASVFNLGHTPQGLKRKLAQQCLSSVDVFLVHSKAEIKVYSEWLELSPTRFQFVPLQRPSARITHDENTESPYLIALGSAQRDYRVLFQALAKLRYRTIVVAAEHAVSGFSVPSNVSVRSGLSAVECHELLQGARAHVLPLRNRTTASGQVTLLDAMAFGKASVVTESPGTVDYVDNGIDGSLVPPDDCSALVRALERVWDDAQLRRKLGENARKRLESAHSDPVAGRHLGAALDRFESGYQFKC